LSLLGASLLVAIQNPLRDSGTAAKVFFKHLYSKVQGCQVFNAISHSLDPYTVEATGLLLCSEQLHVFSDLQSSSTISGSTFLCNLDTKVAVPFS
jgi:hypothetical protein